METIGATPAAEAPVMTALDIVAKLRIRQVARASMTESIFSNSLRLGFLIDAG